MFYVPDEELYIRAVVKHMIFHLKNEYISNWETQINNAPKCSILYKHIKVVFGCEYYLTSLPCNLRLVMSRIRTCNH